MRESLKQLNMGKQGLRVAAYPSAESMGRRSLCRAGTLAGRRALIAFMVTLLLALFGSVGSFAITKIDEFTEAEVYEYAERVAGIKAEAKSQKVGKYGMMPVYGRDVEDGVYDISGESSSAFFKLTECRLTVDGEKLRIRFVIPSKSYLYIYPGTAEEAEDAGLAAGEAAGKAEGETAGEAAWIGFEDSGSAFEMEIPALDTPVKCAAFSKARSRWYDRDLLFDASSLPEGALKIVLPDYAEGILKRIAEDVKVEA